MSAKYTPTETPATTTADTGTIHQCRAMKLRRRTGGAGAATTIGAERTRTAQEEGLDIDRTAGSAAPGRGHVPGAQAAARATYGLRDADGQTPLSAARLHAIQQTDALVEAAGTALAA